MNKLTNWLKAGVLVASSWVVTGCGSANQSLIQNFFSTVELTSRVENRDVWVDVKAKIQTGNFRLMGGEIPLVNPKDPSQALYGKLHFDPITCFPATAGCQEGGQLTVSVNLTETAKLDAVDNTLPNGQPLPFDVTRQRALSVALGQTGGKTYYITGNSQAILGLAIPFKAFDVAGKHVPGVSIFEPLQFGPISGLGGFFTSHETKSTGLAFFVDLAGLVKKNASPTVQTIQYRPSNRPRLNAVSFSTTSPGKVKEYRLLSKIHDLHQQRAALAW